MCVSRAMRLPALRDVPPSVPAVAARAGRMAEDEGAPGRQVVLQGNSTTQIGESLFISRTSSVRSGRLRGLLFIRCAHGYR